MSMAPRLTETELVRQRLAECESIMKRCWQDFAKQLAVIRDEELHRADFDTFDKYCQERLGIRRDIADKQIAASRIATDLHTMVWIPNERTAREFKEVAKEDRPKVAETAKTIAAEKGRDTINSRDVKEAKAKVYKVETTIEELPRTEEAEPLPTEPDPVTLADDTEGGWLESLPLSAQLQGLPLRKFEEAARLWQQFEAPFKSLAQQIRHEQKSIKVQFHSRFFVQQRASFVIDEPQHWLLCRECQGTGQVQQVGHCSSCNGDGFYASQYKGR